MVKRSVVWDNSARQSLKDAYEYIRRNSPQGAEIVRSRLINACEQLSIFPERYPPDKYRLDGDSRFRAFEVYNYRVSYFVAETQVRILRLRHVSQIPILH
jgi:plasmid stabilization system protein ParE